MHWLFENTTLILIWLNPNYTFRGIIESKNAYLELWFIFPDHFMFEPIFVSTRGILNGSRSWHIYRVIMKHTLVFVKCFHTHWVIWLLPCEGGRAVIIQLRQGGTHTSLMVQGVLLAVCLLLSSFCGVKMTV